ncbi:hypothetical protein ACEYYA_02545 [Paracoccus sp. p3-h83]|uniref:hypothetical protein n=1 Tax=Paracoccus sp. p3-h83 TaxID=3342805 RepID=UPI0035B73C0F
MADDKITVRLTGPAKIGPDWHDEGADVPVTPDVARELAAAGLITDSDSVAVQELAPGMPGFDEAVAAMAKVLADAAVSAAIDAALVEVIAERDSARAHASAVEATVSRQDVRIMELEARAAELEEQLVASTAGAPPADPSVAKDAKPAQKSGAARKG